MSVEGQVLGASTVAGSGAGVASQLANTGNPVLVGIVTAVAMIVVLGLITRATQSNR
jgi:hypothetical protein